MTVLVEDHGYPLISIGEPRMITDESFIAGLEGRTVSTEAGNRYHDAAWRDEANRATHTYLREGCPGCAWIAEIESEARAAALREVAEAVVREIAAADAERRVAPLHWVLAILTAATGASE